MDISRENLLSLLNQAFLVARREGLCEADAEDVSSAALLSYIEVAAKVQHPSAWVRLVSRRKAWASRRVCVGRTQYEFDLLSDAQHADSEPLEKMLDLKMAIGVLRPTVQASLLLRYLKGESFGIIANATGLSERTVKRRLRKSRHSLQRVLTRA